MRTRLLWDIFEEHLDEAAFLWGQWEAALCAANYTLHEVANGPEERLLAHLDGLVLGGKVVAQELLLPALSADDPERVAAAAWALVQTEDGADYQDSVIRAWKAADPKVGGVVSRALALCPRLDVGRIAHLWRTAEVSHVRTASFELSSLQDPVWARAQLPGTLQDTDPAVVAAALRTLRRLLDRTLQRNVEACLQHSESEVRKEALMTAIALKLPSAWDACREAAQAGDETSRLPLALLASSPHPQHRASVLSAADSAANRKHALWALGFVGDLTAIDAITALMADTELARSAGEAFSAVTGVAIEGALLVCGTPQGPDEEQLSDDEPPPSVQPEDRLPMPNAANIQVLWQRARRRYESSERYIMGQPRRQVSLCTALMYGSMWRRDVLWTELASTYGSAPPVDLRAWARAQSRSLKQACASPAAQ